MTPSIVRTHVRRFSGRMPRAGRRSALLIVSTMLAAVAPAIAQNSGGAGAELQQKLAAVKQSLAENQKKLHQYQWTETQQLTLKGEPKAPSQSVASMGRTGRY